MNEIEILDENSPREIRQEDIDDDEDDHSIPTDRPFTNSIRTSNF